MSDFEESQVICDEDVRVFVGTPKRKLKQKRAEKQGRVAKRGLAPSAPKKFKVSNNHQYMVE